MGRKAVDMVGKVVGYLTVVERHFTEGQRGGKHVQWLCRCECGNTVVKDAGDIRRAKFMSCGCVQGNPSLRKDHIGVRYGKATGIRETGEVKFSQRVWLWKCDCGEEFESVAGGYVHRGYSPGCHKCVAEENFKQLSERSTTHGMSHTKEWKAWNKVKDRVLNPSNPDYVTYSVLGIDEWIAQCFENFYAEIGPHPKDGQRWSVGRIDNDVGYRVGNIRWETDAQQARNKGKMSNNTSGYTGVKIDEKSPGRFYAVATWRDRYGKPCQKSFSFKTYGEELALLCAIEARDKAIRLLNQQGAGYSPKHGI